MNKKKKTLTILILLLGFVWSGAQVGLAQSVDSPTTGGIRFKVSEDATSESTGESTKPSDTNETNDSNGNSNNLGNDSEKDLSKNAVNLISDNNRSGKSSNLPSMGEIAVRSLPIIGAILVLFVIYLFIKKKKDNKN